MKGRRFALPKFRLVVLVSLILGLAAASVYGQNATAIAYDHVRENLHQLGLTGSDVNELAVSSTVVSRHNGVTHVYFRQRYRDIDVYGAILNVNVGADGQVLGAGHRLVANVARAAGGQNARKTAVDAA